MSVDAYKDDADFIAKIVRDEVKGAIDPLGNRIIKILMKIGKATGGLLFTMIKLLLLVINPNKLHTFKELLGGAMKLGVEYMRVKDFAVDEFVADGERLVEQSQRL